MTTIHDSFLQSPHGVFVESPHGVRDSPVDRPSIFCGAGFFSETYHVDLTGFMVANPQNGNIYYAAHNHVLNAWYGTPIQLRYDPAASGRVIGDTFGGDPCTPIQADCIWLDPLAFGRGFQEHVYPWSLEIPGVEPLGNGVIFDIWLTGPSVTLGVAAGTSLFGVAYNWRMFAQVVSVPGHPPPTSFNSWQSLNSFSPIRSFFTYNGPSLPDNDLRTQPLVSLPGPELACAGMTQGVNGMNVTP